MRKSFRYVDLFAGIGGFHLAMDEFSRGKAKCLMASEIDKDASRVYEDNFGLAPMGDIKNIKSLPKGTEVVLGGFPCQTFSKAGKREGFSDARGTLFAEIVRLVRNSRGGDLTHKPKLLLLENEGNHRSHDDGNTWGVIPKEQRDAGYTLNNDPFLLSPLQFGIPQSRTRAYIPCVRKDIYEGVLNLRFPFKTDLEPVQGVLESGPEEPLLFTEAQERVLRIWDRFMDIVGHRSIGFPVWSDYFDGLACEKDDFPDWKKGFIHKNIALYRSHEAELSDWLRNSGIRSFPPTWRKFEWQAGDGMQSVFEGIIQFRTSGIRVKKPDFFPALVAMVHLPYYGPLHRALTVRECARLQSFPDDYRFDESPQKAYRQLGNAVNVRVVRTVFQVLLSFLHERGCSL